jgi:hypothetical protein
MEILKLPGQNTHTVHDWWALSTLVATWPLTEVKIATVVMELTAGDQMATASMIQTLPG